MQEQKPSLSRSHSSSTLNNKKIVFLGRARASKSELEIDVGTVSRPSSKSVTTIEESPSSSTDETKLYYPKTVEPDMIITLWETFRAIEDELILKPDISILKGEQDLIHRPSFYNLGVYASRPFPLFPHDVSIDRLPDGSIGFKGGSLEGFVNTMLIPGYDAYQFVKDGLMVLDYVLPRTQFMDMLIQRFIEVEEFEINEFVPEHYIILGPTTRLRILMVLNMWVQDYFCDFIYDKQLCYKLFSLINYIRHSSINIDQEYSNMLTNTIKKQLFILASRTSDFDAQLLVGKLFFSKDRSKLMFNTAGASVLDMIGNFLSVELQKSWTLEPSESQVLVEHLISQGIIDESNGDIKISLRHEVPLTSHSDMASVTYQNIMSSYSVKVIGQQLTLIEWSLFCEVQISEFYHTAWTDKEKQHEIAPRLMKLIARTNKLNYWIITEIVTCTSLRKRVSKIIHFVQLAQYLISINNFHTAFSIISGLNSGALSRMVLTWEAVPYEVVQSLQELKKICNNTQNWKVYRDMLNDITNTKNPFFPYIGLVFSDLAFTEAGNQTIMNKDEVKQGTAEPIYNFKKISYLSSIIKYILLAKQRNFHYFTRNEPLLLYLTHFLQTIETTEELFEASKECESSEKVKQYKELKQKLDAMLALPPEQHDEKEIKRVEREMKKIQKDTSSFTDTLLSVSSTYLDATSEILSLTKGSIMKKFKSKRGSAVKENVSNEDSQQ
eukprot:TRINITY_DN2616_c0_g1_i1.p1 TRINITY_DN2616_c0_g1~~TRINITY_DN2616_c0_g1_i1.p1  ORF type:complete len:723 (-),score=129.32 TRINITY_DN2616_c0_g1_i1:184-2352(-)